MQPEDKNLISIELRENYGVVVFVDDWNIADDFEDYLAIEEYVKYDMTTEDIGETRRTGFWFGCVSDLDKVSLLVNRFFAQAK